MVELIEDFSLVGFYTLCIEDKASVLNLMKQIDRANGYVFGGLERGNDSIFQVISSIGAFESISDVQDKYMAHAHDIPDITESTNIL